MVWNWLHTGMCFKTKVLQYNSISKNKFEQNNTYVLHGQIFLFHLYHTVIIFFFFIQNNYPQKKFPQLNSKSITKFHFSSQFIMSILWSLRLFRRFDENAFSCLPVIHLRGGGVPTDLSLTMDRSTKSVPSNMQVTVR